MFVIVANLEIERNDCRIKKEPLMQGEEMEENSYEA